MQLQKLAVSLLDRLATKLGPLAPFAKAVIPAALALVVAIVKSAVAGHVDTQAIDIAVSGLVLAAVTFLVPNKAAPAAPVKPSSGSAKSGK